VTVWVKDNQQAPFVYDTTWGGTVSCGCLYNNGVCTNTNNPTSNSTSSTDLDCPAFTDPGLNFGNGVYNDHHFHYNYLVYAAAVLSHFDADWSIKHFEHVLLLVRDYANPSPDDVAYPTFRHKDWYKGHSWASGITDPVFPNIMNQESSSEAIAAYEAVALFGQVMSKNFDAVGDVDKTNIAKQIENVGLVLVATEIRSTQKYWQIYDDDDNSRSNSTSSSLSHYPEPPYEAGVVGILWETMIQFTTWFGNSPYLIYGIQLLPITPISEQRDSQRWAEAIYTRLASSCDNTCVSEGWSIQIFALLATLGHIDDAVSKTNELSPSVYVGPGGNGHSKSNTIWYIATRPAVANPATLLELPDVEILEVTCGQPTLCTSEVLDSLAGDHTCRSRIEWVMNVEGMSETASCSQVSGEWTVCQACNPLGDVVTDVNDEVEDWVVDEDEDSIGSGGSNGGGVVQLTCFQPTSCTSTVLSRMADGFTCRERIEFLMDASGQSESSACRQISVNEYPEECGLCAPPTGGRRRLRS
jgi:Glycosyl hydrolase family 81 C-terminal domain